MRLAVKSNGLLKWLLIPAAAFVAYIFFRNFNSQPAPSRQAPAGSTLSITEMKSLGVEGDTPEDTVATLVGEVKQLRKELQRTVGENKSRQTENERLRQHAGNVDKRISAAIDAERERARSEQDLVTADQQRARTLLEELERRLDGLSPQQGAQDLPVGLGLGDDSQHETDQLVWIEPADADARATGKRPKTSLVDDFSENQGGFSEAIDAGVETTLAGARDLATRRRAVTPTYTIPADATLSDSIAMTALVGRIPIDRAVTDAFPFKAVVGSRNLTANGIELPGLRGAVVSGMASGDWTLSCVRGRIHSITFVFDDSRVVSYPPTRRRGDNDADQSTQSGFGYISDRHGIPCVSGERVSNASQYLGTQALVTAAGAGVAAMMKPEEGSATYLSNNGTTLGSIGISGNEAVNRILGRGVDDISDWVRRLYGEAFPAIYVKPGAEIAMHIEEPIQIDYDKSGRKVQFNVETSNDDYLE